MDLITIYPENDRLRILAMLSTTNYEQKQRKLHNLRHRGTCDWLFKTSQFIEWRYVVAHRTQDISHVATPASIALAVIVMSYILMLT